MKLARFMLEEWLEGHRDPSIRFYLGGSTGPVWTVRELLELDGAGSLEQLLDADVVYAPSIGSESLRQAIAQMQSVPDEYVLVFTGAAEALAHIVATVAEPGANVVVPFPCFPPHQWLPDGLGLEVRLYRLRRENGFRIDADEIVDLIDARTRVVLVNSPHNPTGSTISEPDLRRLHDVAAQRGIQFVSDEVYHPIYHGQQTPSAAMLPAATVVGDLSKAFSLSGLRIGWMVEPDARRRAVYENAREYYTIANSPISEYLAEIAVRHRDEIFARTREVASANLQLLEKVFDEHAELLRWVRPQGGMIAFPWLVSGEETRSLCEEAAAEGVLMVPGDCFGLPDHLRIGFGVGREWYAEAMQRLSALLSRCSVRAASPTA
ncbi:MAG: aminotransferase class I/II-fold pyridoxal phosphate-dependent enzyme [Candidatus Eremiobacteraeota bacterium]|nr:aminotransferase class I/II-fold pyridoxal phosphate-dependent enzyme [Candidatus Eremiobacteraeota bacterium]